MPGTHLLSRTGPSDAIPSARALLSPARTDAVLGVSRTAVNPFGLLGFMTSASAEDFSPSAAFPKWNMQGLNIKGSLLCLTYEVCEDVL